MAPHSSTLAWKIPWMEEPGELQSMGSLRVGHDSMTSLSLFTFMLWRRKWQPTPVFLPGESQGWGSLVGCCLWGRTELDTTEATQQQQHGVRKCSNFIVLHVAVQFSQHHLLKKLSLPHCIFFPPMSKVGTYSCMGLFLGFLSCSICLYFCFCASTIL